MKISETTKNYFKGLVPNKARGVISVALIATGVVLAVLGCAELITATHPQLLTSIVWKSFSVVPWPLSSVTLFVAAELGIIGLVLPCTYKSKSKKIEPPLGENHEPQESSSRSSSKSEESIETSPIGRRQNETLDDFKKRIHWEGHDRWSNEKAACFDIPDDLCEVLAPANYFYVFCPSARVESQVVKENLEKFIDEKEDERKVLPFVVITFRCGEQAKKPAFDENMIKTIAKEKKIECIIVHLLYKMGEANDDSYRILGKNSNNAIYNEYYTKTIGDLLNFFKLG